LSIIIAVDIGNIVATATATATNIQCGIFFPIECFLILNSFTASIYFPSSSSSLAVVVIIAALSLLFFDNANAHCNPTQPAGQVLIQGIISLPHH
jgi:hypothetical protein